MVFSSIPFLYYFLPAVLILYFAVPRGLRNFVLFAASLLFYAWGEPRCIFLMLLQILAGFLSGLFLERTAGTRKARPVFAVSVLIPLACLGYFKYADFFVENFCAVTGIDVPLLRISLPVGISFYTFQIISYLADVYGGTVRAQRNPLVLGTYIAMFPQLIAGPIVRYSDVEKELRSRKSSLEDVASGAQRLVLGLAKKILLADSLGALCLAFRESQDLSVLFYWLYAVSVALQIYLDFSGYSDMAIGLGRIFGFHFPENFRYPYLSGSITEFWRRWHISLGTWFRDYVYIPLGGNRVSLPRWLLNVLAVWMLTGLWHGAAWNFVVWGLFFAFWLIAEKLWLKKYLDRTVVLRHGYVLLVVIISFVIFDAADLREAGLHLAGMFGLQRVPAVSAQAWYLLKNYSITILLSGIAATPVPKMLMEKIRGTAVGAKVLNAAEPLALTVLLLVVTAYLVDGSFRPFLYFRF